MRLQAAIPFSRTFVAPSLAMKIRKILRFPRRMLWALLLEGVETHKMMRTFVKAGRGKLLMSTNHKPTEEEMQQAVEQLKDLPRFLPFVIVIAAPVPGIIEGYTLLAISLEKFLGNRVSLLPSRVRQIFHKHRQEDDPMPF